MVLKLYGSAMSTSRVLVTILEKELPYEFIRIDIAKGDQKSEDYMKLQPFGKVPVLDDDGFVMFESRAICKYLDQKYPSGKKLIPEGDEAYGRFEQACSVEQSYFAAAAETLGTELVIKPMKGLGVPDEARVAQAEKDLDTVLAVYDKILAKQKYLVGDELTLVDLFHLPNGAALKGGRWKEVFKKYPNVDKWLKGLQERETWIRAATEARTIA
ncbi:Glutathione-S-transferase [Lasiodiplodia theobromae]|uniref:Glutathione-S-transferase n=1 Tax=Lasiodiplodia theobromae TaxID=45133 RepID=UPI0015C3BC7D|nr:Glutathione-S-transferase [Lasiodiplodia theobromae]KAF4545924.1 Glutathione-S-transferase [Lasiodiplodia theobromae]